jgi:cytochrome c
MSTPNWIRLVFLLCLALAGFTSQAGPEGPRLGKTLTPAEMESEAIHVFPDGTGLPEGSGDSVTGEKLYQSLCASCHGPAGTGGSAGELVGKSPLNGPHPDQSIGNYWPYATTIFDFIRRSMPLNAPRSLSADQTYAITAYLLEINGIITKGTTVNRSTLPSVRMPNRDGFISLWPTSK